MCLQPVTRTSYVRSARYGVFHFQAEARYVLLRTYPPNGRLRIAAPRRLPEPTIRAFAAAKLRWIREQQRKLREQERETNREYLDRESRHVFGKRYLLRVVEENVPASVERKHQRLVLTARPGTSEEARQAILDKWYRQLLRESAWST